MGKSGRHGDETEEEKRARRLAKKEAKRAKEAEGLAGYSNEANPWNDPHLADAFVWGKKNEKARAAAALRACFFLLSSVLTPTRPLPSRRPRPPTPPLVAPTR